MPALKTLLIVAALANIACHSARKPDPKPIVVWHPIAAWTGHGNQQTDSFEMGNAEWRIKWETTQESSPGAGRFKVDVHSAISGRPLIAAVDYSGVGHDMTYVTEDPRLFYLVIDSSNVNWAITVEESIVTNGK
ncbi:MAG TPA: hypothetical protein VKR43_17415 [Bryobacteraceae bacterium]|nr:hypothetical protein [Bryobacteraceae bacterium]